jgi:alpha-L-rhamnosidase
MDCLPVPFKKKVRDILEYFASKENEYGLLEGMEGWVFLEWSKASDFMEDVNFPSNMLYCAALETAGRLLNEPSLTEKALRLKKTIKEISFNGEWFIDNAVRKDGKLELTENTSETCQYFAMFFQILTKAEAPAFYEKMLGEFGAFRAGNAYAGVHPSNMFIGYVVRLMLLAKAGYRELLLKECKHTFASMARATSTIWELFADNASCNHGFGSILGKLICEAAIGFVRTDEKDKKIYVHKDYAMRNACLQLPLQKGMLKIEIADGVRKITVSDGYEILTVND